MLESHYRLGSTNVCMSVDISFWDSSHPLVCSLCRTPCREKKTKIEHQGEDHLLKVKESGLLCDDHGQREEKSFSANVLSSPQVEESLVSVEQG